MVGARIKIIWQEQLVDSPIDYLTTVNALKSSLLKPKVSAIGMCSQSGSSSLYFLLKENNILERTNEALMVSLIAVDGKLRLNILLWPPAAGPLTSVEPSSLYNDQNLGIIKIVKNSSCFLEQDQQVLS